MKPEWNDAPDWANYLAMDMDGNWYWYENAPSIEGANDDVWSFDQGKIERIEIEYPNWKESLEQRPIV